MRPAPRSRHPRAFTLAEISIVLIIVGLVMTMLFPALRAVRNQTAADVTQRNLWAVMRASAAYAAARGCLPCPTPPTQTGAGFGRVRGDAAASPAACSGSVNACSPEGIVPFASLGLPPQMAKDGYGRFLSMRIDPVLALNFGVIPPFAPCTAQDVTNKLCTTAGASQKGLCTAGLSAISSSQPISVSVPAGATARAAIMLVSHGPNGYGAFLADPARTGSTAIQRLGVATGTTPACSTGAEACNASSTTQFVDARQGDGFDDQLLYLDRDALISLFGQGSCQTVW